MFVEEWLEFSKPAYTGFDCPHADELIVGYATSNAYRKVFELIQEHRPDFILLPTKPKQKRLSEFFRHVHLDELIEVLSTVLEIQATGE